MGNDGINNSSWQRLIVAARAMAQRAYAPYSQFRVGAALLGEDGAVYCGANVENASYGLTLCAERNAVYQGVLAGCQRFLGLVVYTPTPSPTSPCGSCRQVLREFCTDLPILAVCDGEARLTTSLATLLPVAFGPDQLFASE